MVQNIRLISCKRRVTWPNAEKEVSIAVLALDGQGRISSETLTDTTHLISRHFVYDAYER